MRIRFADVALLVLALVVAQPAGAHHVAWLDFSTFNLSQFPTVNGHAPTANDRTAIENLVFAKMQEHFALFDIHLVRYQPTEGIYTRLRFHGDRRSLFGCTGSSCCAFTNCTGPGSWNTRAVSGAEVYAGTLAAYAEFQGSNADTARIARALANTGSHQLGYVLGLTNCHADGSFVGSGFDSSVERTSCGSVGTRDAGRNFHIMASGTATGLTRQQMAERDLFFSVRSSRRTLYRLLQPRNHWQKLQSLDGDARGDLFLHRFATPLDVELISRPSTGSSFGPSNTTLLSSAGDRGDTFYATGGTVARARPLSGSSVEWRLLTADGALALLRSDAGNVGSIFRWASIINLIPTGRQDLFFGRPPVGDSTEVSIDWWVNPLDSFAPALLTSSVVFRNVFRPLNYLFAPGVAEQSLVSAGDRRKVEDLFVVDRDTSLTGVVSIVGYISEEAFPGGQDAFFLWAGTIPADYVFFADVDRDRDDDLVIGKVRSDAAVDWTVRKNDDDVGQGRAPRFSDVATTTSDRGDAGCHFRIGDVDGDSRADLIIGYPVGREGLTANPSPDVVRWAVARSNGSTFGSEETWISDWGREGDVFP